MTGGLVKSVIWLGLFAAGALCYRILADKVYVAPGDWSAYWPFPVFAILALMLLLVPRGRA
jgi:hypothetical protein